MERNFQQFILGVFLWSGIYFGSLYGAEFQQFIFGVFLWSGIFSSLFWKSFLWSGIFEILLTWDSSHTWREASSDPLVDP
jgi:hypothetical protein